MPTFGFLIMLLIGHVDSVLLDMDLGIKKPIISIYLCCNIPMIILLAWTNFVNWKSFHHKYKVSLSLHLKFNRIFKMMSNVFY
jgi:hypothetical protein